MRRGLWAVVVGVGIAAALVAANVVTRDEPEDVPRVVIGRGPDAYAIEYRVEERVGDDTRVSRERVQVRRAFQSRVERTTDGERRLSEIWTLGKTSSRRPNADAAVLEMPIAATPADVRLRTVVDPARRKNVLQRRERRRVLGRPCQVFRSRDRFTAETLRTPTKDEFVDSCVDADGLLLDEVQKADGRQTLRRTATRVDVAPSFAGDAFTVGAANLKVEQGGGSTRAIDPATSPPGRFWVLDTAPNGFTPGGRYVVIPPQPENFADPTREGSRRAGTVDVYVKGSDAIVIDQGGTLRRNAPFERDKTLETIAIPALGTAEILYTARGPELRVITDPGRYVRVYGTVSVGELVAVARALRATEGSDNLRFL